MFIDLDMHLTGDRLPGVISVRLSELGERGNAAAQSVCCQVLTDQRLPCAAACIACQGRLSSKCFQWHSADLAVQGSSSKILLARRCSASH